MISQKSAAEVTRVVREWAGRNGVPAAEVRELFRLLGAVAGNQSFRQSLALLRKVLEVSRES
jgi:hypothetical protein